MQTILKMTESLNSSLSDDALRVYGVGGETSIREIWKHVAPLLDKSIPYAAGKYSLEDIKKAILRSDMQLWIGCDASHIIAACVTQVIDYPQSKRAIILFLGGERINELLKVQPIFEWAKGLGCSHVELFGRPGWERFFKKTEFHFEKIHTVLELTL